MTVRDYVGRWLPCFLSHCKPQELCENQPREILRYSQYAREEALVDDCAVLGNFSFESQILLRPPKKMNKVKMYMTKSQSSSKR